MTEFDLYLEDHHLMLRDMVREFAEQEIAPVAAAPDENDEFPWENAAKMAELGLFGIPWPEEYGGAGMDLMASVIVSEELARVDASHSITIGAHTSLCGVPIYRCSRCQTASLHARNRRYRAALLERDVRP